MVVAATPVSVTWISVFVAPVPLPLFTGVPTARVQAMEAVSSMAVMTEAVEPTWVTTPVEATRNRPASQ